MKAYPDCIACMFKQALNTARLVTEDPNVHVRVLKTLAARVAETTLDQTPAALSQPAYEVITEVTGVRDPYAALKRESNAATLGILPDLEEEIEKAADPLDAALHAAVAGNIIDLGIGHEFDIERDVLEMMSQPFAISALDDFRNELRPGRRLLYLGDNAGEIVLDRLLIDRLTALGLAVTVTVKSGPIINDATMVDAREAGLFERVEVIETGSADIGVNWERVSDAFRTAFTQADLIISKGHGNFETCNERPENIYFLLKAKCPMVASELGCRLWDIVFTRMPSG